MKRTQPFALLLIGLVAVSLCGCQGKEDPSANQTPPVGADAKPDAVTNKAVPGAASLDGGGGAQKAAPSEGLVK